MKAINWFVSKQKTIFNPHWSKNKTTKRSHNTSHQHLSPLFSICYLCMKKNLLAKHKIFSNKQTIPNKKRGKHKNLLPFELCFSATPTLCCYHCLLLLLRVLFVFSVITGAVSNTPRTWKTNFVILTNLEKLKKRVLYKSQV